MTAGRGEKEGEERIETRYPPPALDEPPPPTFRQALVGYGSIFAILVAFAVLLGILMRVLR